MLEVAKSSRIITPSGSVPIAGHAMRTESSTGVHDELEVHVLLLNLEGIKCCFINADVIGAGFDFVRRVKTTVHELLDIDPALVIFSVTHTHTGPYFGLSAMTGTQTEAESQYEDEVLDKTIEAVLDAAKQWTPFTDVIVRQGEVKGFYGNRNGLDKPGDEVITDLEFRDQTGKPVAAFVNMSCHSTIMNPLETRLSADMLGNVRRELTPYLGVVPLMSNGNAGDLSNRLYRHGDDFNELKRVTSGIAAHIAGFRDGAALCLTPVRHREVAFEVDYDNDKAALAQALAKLEQQLSVVTEFDDRKWLLSEISGYQRKLAQDHVHVCLNSTILRLGDLELVVVPCELASAFGRQIKRSSNAKLCLVWGYANGCSTYVVEASEFNGGHDGISTRLLRGQAEEYVAKLIQNLF